MKARIESYLERKAACVRGRYTVELRREAVELWTEQVSDGVSETDAAKVLGHSCFILRSWRSPRSAQAPAIVPVVIRPTRKKRDKRVLSVEAYSSEPSLSCELSQVQERSRARAYRNTGDRHGA